MHDEHYSRQEREKLVLDFVHSWLISKHVPVSTSEIIQGIGHSRKSLEKTIRSLTDQRKLKRTPGHAFTIPRKKIIY